MDTPAHVVVGDDGSVGASLAWGWVSAQDWDGWAVDVVTADEPEEYPVRAELAAPRPWQSPHPRAFEDPTRVTGGVRHLVAVGDPRAVLLAFPDAALMVVGRRGRGLLAALRLGSTTGWLLHGPPCPLVIAVDDLPVRRVVVCADGSDAALVAAEAFARLPLATGADVEVLSVADGRTDPDAVTRKVLGVMADAGVAARVSDRTGEPGDPREVIVDVAATAGADLVVLGTRGVGISVLRRVLGGSVASYVSHHAPCSVLVADVPPTGRRLEHDQARQMR